MNLRRKQDGFGAVEILIILAVIVLLAVGGWYVYQMQSKPNETSQPSNNDTQNTVEPDTKKYFESPDMGVRFELSEELQQANLTSSFEVYQSHLGADHRGGAPAEAKVLYLSTQDVKDAYASLSENCHTGKPGTLANITRYEGSHASTHGNLDDHDHFSAVYSFEGFHLLANGSSSGLFSQSCWAGISQEIQDKADRLEVLLLEAFKTAEPI